MKKLFTLILTILLLLNILPVSASSSDEPVINCEAAVLMDAETGQILYEKNAHEVLYPASITKIMTTYLAITKGNLDDEVQVSAEAIDQVSRSATHIALNYGETVRIEDMLYASMLNSANDACNVLAEYIGGTLDDFAVLMNETAKEAGALNTNFTNSNGLIDENHVTTAYDMAMITKYCMQSEAWMELFGTTYWHMEATDMNDARDFWAGHQMLQSNTVNYNENVIGGKTGYTEEAGYTMVTVCQMNGKTLISVVLGCETGQDRYTNTQNLFDYGYSAYETKTFTKDEFVLEDVEVTKNDVVIGKLSFSLDEDIQLYCKSSTTLADLTSEVEVVNNDLDAPEANLNIYQNDEELVSVPLTITVTKYRSNIIKNVLLLVLKLAGLALLLLVLLVVSVIVYGKRHGLKMRKWK